MLDFILVLGQIPGTNIQLSFWQLIVLVLALLLGVRIWRRPALRHKYIYYFRSLRRPQN